MRNYIFSEFTEKAQIFTQKKKESYNLQNFNETLMKYNNNNIIINLYIFVISIKSTHEKLYAIYIEWTKLSEIENHLSFIWLLHAVETIIMRLCIKLVHVDCTLKNEWLSHFKLLQKLCFHHHSCSCSETLRDSNDYLIVQDVNVL